VKQGRCRHSTTVVTEWDRCRGKLQTEITLHAGRYLRGRITRGRQSDRPRRPCNRVDTVGQSPDFVDRTALLPRQGLDAERLGGSSGPKTIASEYICVFRHLLYGAPCRRSCGAASQQFRTRMTPYLSRLPSASCPTTLTVRALLCRRCWSLTWMSAGPLHG